MQSSQLLLIFDMTCGQIRNTDVLANMVVVGCYQRWPKAASRCDSRCVEQEHVDAGSQGDDGRAIGPLRTTAVPAGLPAV